MIAPSRPKEGTRAAWMLLSSASMVQNFTAHSIAAVLAAYGKELQGMALQGYLFFGTANRLYEKVKALLAGQSPHSLTASDST